MPNTENNANNVVSEGITYTPSDTAYLIENIEILSNNVKDLTKQISDREKREIEEDKKNQEEQEKITKQEEQEKISNQEKQDQLLQQFSLLVKNSDQQENLTYQEQITSKLDEIIMQNQINYIFMGIIIAFFCVSIFQKAFKR